MTIAYSHRTHPRAKGIRLKIEPDGQVVVVTPSWLPKFLINQFVNQHQDWIAKHLARQRRSAPRPVKSDEVAIFGHQYQVKAIHQPDQPIGAKLTGQSLMINSLSPQPSQHQLDKALDLFLKGTAEKYLLPRAYQLGKLMNIEFKRLTLRQQKSRWGSCSSRGTLSFNWRLVHFAPAIIDYVIIHELAHRVHMNHSAAFWQLVKIYDAKYLLHRRILSRHHIHFT